VRLSAPVGSDLPRAGFDRGVTDGYVPPPPDSVRGGVAITVAPTSERLQLLTPFARWDGNDFVDMPVLVKAAGKCTTDAISAAGPWLRSRGHLERISANLFLGAVNAFTGEVGTGRDPLDGATRPFPEIAARLAAAGVRWCVIADANYGEGSSREHAALEPRYRGGAVIIARSFARIHETNLKRQGLLALTFEDPHTYDRIGADDRISVVGLRDVAPGQPVRAEIVARDGSRTAFVCRHTYTAEQIEWFRAGSALNAVRTRRALDPAQVPL
jgi:aconitate hydratase